MILKTSQFGQPTPVAETKERQHFSLMTMEILSFSIPISTSFGKAEPPGEKSDDLSQPNMSHIIHLSTRNYKIPLLLIAPSPMILIIYSIIL